MGGSLLAVLTAGESHKQVIPFRVSILRDRRMVLYAGLFLSGHHTHFGCMA